MEKFIVDENLQLNEQNLKLFADYYREYLQKDMLHNWEVRVKDEKCGGYITCFDNKWNVTSFDKGAWGQCRHIFTFSYASKVFADKQKWLDLAKVGADFVVNKMYNEKSCRLNYLVDRTGNTVKESETSIFSDAFAISGLAEYILASGDKSFLKTLENMFDVFQQNLTCDTFKDTMPYVYSEGIVYHAVFMIAINSVFVASGVLGKEKTDRLIDFCLDKILNVLYDDKYGLIFEKKKSDGSFADDENAKLVNAGHILEDMWFLFEIARERKDEKLECKVVDIVENLYSLMEKCNKDLIFAYNFGVEEERKVQTWKYENSFGYTDNVSWTFAEAMCLNGIIASNLKSQKHFTRFVKIRNYTQKYFIDQSNGDWFHALDKDNNVIEDYKGSTVKTAYHMPRAFMKIIENFEKY